MSDDTWDGASPWLFLVGLVVFLGSALLFVADLLRGADVLRGIAANAVGIALLIGWAAYDTLFDPNSEVATWGGAAGTALLLYGLYLLLAGLVIGATGLFFHEYTTLGLWYLGLAVGAVLVGFLAFPTGMVADTEGASDSGPDEGTDSDVDGGSDPGDGADTEE